MLALIDYGSGNLRSVHKALLEVGASVKLVRQGDELSGATGLVLPGVGAFDDCLNALRTQGLLDPILSYINGKRPFLGICVGYQALFQRSEEFQSRAPGLGFFEGPVVRFSRQSGLKIPQIGWNRLEIARPECPLYRGIPNGSHVYFVHSYHPSPADPSIVATWTDYGGRFASSAWRENVFATQFHPEKSQAVGLKILRNFAEYAEATSISAPPA
ncbi:MAG: imidazole glycerol phosphate synthase subunit HisH [Verrucomicrobiales bacterium]|nr:imidazole glycerol phosphate synthase subunit HisH [Verrucomicrobiales bacterium]